MSFYVNTQLEALKIGLSVAGRDDIAALESIEAMGEHADVEMTNGKITNILDDDGKYAREAIYLTLEVDDWEKIGQKRTTQIGSAPFRSGFDIWFLDPETGIGCRWNP